MLALKQALSLVSMKETSGWTPDNVSNLELWLKNNALIEADQNSSGGSLDPVHTTTANTMETGDLINIWNDFALNDYNALQDTEDDKPAWNR